MKERNRGLSKEELQELREGLADEGYAASLGASVSASLEHLTDSEIATLQAELQKAKGGKSSFGKAVSQVTGDSHRPALDIYDTVATQKPSVLESVLGGLFGRKR